METNNNVAHMQFFDDHLVIETEAEHIAVKVLLTEIERRLS